MDGVLSWLLPLLEQYAQQYPWLATVVFVMGSFRLFLKPVMSIIEAVVGLTASPKDDEFLAKVLDHKAYKAVAYVLDWLGSIKLPKKEG